MPFRKFSDTQVREMYKYAAKNRLSIRQACRNRGLSNNDYEIMRNWGRKLCLKCLTPAEMTGHSERDSQLYVLIVHGEKTGLYVGSSTDPNLRFKQHIQKAKRDGKDGVNKRDRFMYRAQSWKIKIFRKKYKATEIAHYEPRLIAKVQTAFPNAVHLNSLVGAPMGGYGVKLSEEKEQAIIDDYTSDRITTEDLAEKYGVGRGTINRILQRAGATKTRAEMMVKYDDTTRQQIIEDVKSGSTDDEITEKYGMAKHTLYLLKKEHGLTKFSCRKITDISVSGKIFPTLKDACDYFGTVDFPTASRRIRVLNWPVEQALEIEPRITPYNKPLKAVTAFGVEYKSMTHASRAFEMNPQLVAQRVREGWSVEQALTIKAGEGQSCGWNPPPETQNRLEQAKKLGYRSLAEAARAYGIGAGTVSRRLAAGMSVKDALETPLMNGGAVRWSNHA